MTTSSTRSKQAAAAQRLSAEARVAAHHADSVKQAVRSAKIVLKRARKLAKAAKKAAKQARKRAEAAQALLQPAVREPAASARTEAQDPAPVRTKPKKNKTASRSAPKRPQRRAVIQPAVSQPAETAAVTLPAPASALRNEAQQNSGEQHRDGDGEKKRGQKPD